MAWKSWAEKVISRWFQGVQKASLPFFDYFAELSDRIEVPNDAMPATMELRWRVGVAGVRRRLLCAQAARS